MALRIALFGCGTVGQEILRTLHEQGDVISRKLGEPIEVAGVLVRDLDKARAPWVERELLTTDPEPLLSDASVEAVVEVMGGLRPAGPYLTRALRSGKTVITANKELVAESGQELYDAADHGHTDLYFEAAVGGGIPIIRSLKTGLAANHISAVAGILNGTTNFILSSMATEGQTFEEALAEAQRRGYAEADPSADVDGFDAARKLAILCSIGYGSRVQPSDVHTVGLSQVRLAEVQTAARLGYVMKLVATGRMGEAGLEAEVRPTLVPQSHPLAKVEGPDNAILVEAKPLGQALFQGPGAGGGPTASAVLSDLMEAVRERRQGARGLGCTCFYDTPVVAAGSYRRSWFIWLPASEQHGAVSTLVAHLAQQGVDLAQLTANSREVAMITMPCAEDHLRTALADASLDGRVSYYPRLGLLS